MCVYFRSPIWRYALNAVDNELQLILINSEICNFTEKSNNINKSKLQKKCESVSVCLENINTDIERVLKQNDVTLFGSKVTKTICLRKNELKIKIIKTIVSPEEAKVIDENVKNNLENLDHSIKKGSSRVIVQTNSSHAEDTCTQVTPHYTNDKSVLKTKTILIDSTKRHENKHDSVQSSLLKNQPGANKSMQPNNSSEHQINVITESLQDISAENVHNQKKDSHSRKAYEHTTNENSSANIHAVEANIHAVEANIHAVETAQAESQDTGTLKYPNHVNPSSELSCNTVREDTCNFPKDVLLETSAKSSIPITTTKSKITIVSDAADQTRQLSVINEKNGSTASDTSENKGETPSVNKVENTDKIINLNSRTDLHTESSKHSTEKSSNESSDQLLIITQRVSETSGKTIIHYSVPGSTVSHESGTKENMEDTIQITSKFTLKSQSSDETSCKSYNRIISSSHNSSEENSEARDDTRRNLNDCSTTASSSSHRGKTCMPQSNHGSKHGSNDRPSGQKGHNRRGHNPKSNRQRPNRQSYKSPTGKKNGVDVKLFSRGNTRRNNRGHIRHPRSHQRSGGYNSSFPNHNRFEQALCYGNDHNRNYNIYKDIENLFDGVSSELNANHKINNHGDIDYRRGNY